MRGITSLRKIYFQLSVSTLLKAMLLIEVDQEIIFIPGNH